MSKKIFKYALENTDRQQIVMPLGAEILSVQTQNDEPMIWAMVDPEAVKEERYFEIYGTGATIGDDMGVDRKFIGTYQITKGAYNLVFHLFELV